MSCNRSTISNVSEDTEMEEVPWVLEKSISMDCGSVENNESAIDDVLVAHQTSRNKENDDSPDDITDRISPETYQSRSIYSEFKCIEPSSN